MGGDSTREWQGNVDSYLRNTLLSSAGSMDKRWVIWLIAAPAVVHQPLHARESPTAAAREVVAESPSALAVTIYRDPNRSEGTINLDDLGGFALVRETRTITLPAGESRVRFEGVADGIEPASALIEGLPSGLIEKNRDAQLLSPSSLVAATVGKPVTLVRTNAKTGKVEQATGKILADNEGVVFQTEAGIEALRCSGLSETFSFSSREGLQSAPTLSVLVRTPAPVTKVVTLSYLARGFDWTASYTATLSSDNSHMDLGAWVTLANSNGVGFPAAHTQVVAGRVNVVGEGDEEPLDLGSPILAQCWPQGSTSAPAELLFMGGVHPLGFDRMFKRSEAMMMPISASLQESVVTARRVIQEQLGDLKLYRVPERTTVASRQSKQVRLLDKLSIPVHRIYGVTLDERAGDWRDATSQQAASVLLRTKNNVANHLGLPLPSGAVAVFGPGPQGPLLLNEADIGDLAINEDVEIRAGTSSDVQVKAVVEEEAIDPAKDKTLAFLPGLSLRRLEFDDVRRVEVSNARAASIEFELRLALESGVRLVRADHPVGRKNGQPEFRLTIPANQVVTVRYQTAREEVQPVREQQ
jgi:hypothetical protein